MKSPTRVVSGHCPCRIEDPQRQGQRIEPGLRSIGAGHEDDRCGRAAQDAAEPAIGRVHDRLDGEVGREQVGKDHDVGRADDRALDPLSGAGVGRIGQVERERALDHAVAEFALPRCGASARRPRPSRASPSLTVSVAAMSATLGRSTQGIGRHSTALRRMSIRSSQGGLHADARIGQQEPAIVARDLHQDDLADDPAGPQPGFAVEHGLHQVGRRDLAFDEGLRIAGRHQGDGGCGDVVALGIANLELLQVDVVSVGNRADVRLGAKEDWPHPSAITGDPHGFEHSRIIAAGHSHNRPRHALVGIVEESFEAVEGHG